MLGKSFSLASVVGLSGLVVWVGCSDDETNPRVASSDAGSSTPDADPPASVDAGSKDPAPTGAPITYGKCPTFTKCGGDVTGTWNVTGGCLSEDSFTAAKAACAGLKESDVVITATGTVTATATNVKRSTTIKLTGKIAIPKTCTQGAPCGLLGIGLKDPTLAPGGLAFKEATCTDATDVCNCVVGSDLSDSTDSAYTTTPDGTLTTPASGAVEEKTYDYCVAGGKTTYTETTEGQALKLFVEISK